MPRIPYGYNQPSYGRTRYTLQLRAANPYIDPFRGVLLRLKEQLENEWQPAKDEATATRDLYVMLVKDALSAALFHSSNSTDYSYVPNSIKELRGRFAPDWLGPVIHSQVIKAQRDHAPMMQAVSDCDTANRDGLITWLNERLEQEIAKLPPITAPGTPGQGGGAAR